MGNFIKKIFLNGTIETVTGLHICSYNDTFSLGILDYTIVRDPLTHQPFIPASSIKGKLRSLLETSGSAPNGMIAGLFGMPSKTTKTLPGRLLLRDAYLTAESQAVSLPFADLPYTELKKETAIDRNTGKATPTIVERIPAGLFFDLEIIITIYDDDNEADLLQTLFAGLDLLQDDYLGGRGTRGYGAVKFHLQTITEKTKENYINSAGKVPYESAGIPDSLK